MNQQKNKDIFNGNRNSDFLKNHITEFNSTIRKRMERSFLSKKSYAHCKCVLKSLKIKQNRIPHGGNCGYRNEYTCSMVID